MKDSEEEVTEFESHGTVSESSFMYGLDEQFESGICDEIFVFCQL